MIRVNPDRARRYRKRTMTRPPKSYVFTLQEQEAHERWMRAFERDMDEGVPVPPVVEWRRHVEAYCEARHLGRPLFFAEENPLEWSKTLQWSAHQEVRP